MTGVQTCALPISVSFLALAQFRFGSLALSDVVVGLEDRSGEALLVSLQRPAASHHDLRSISLGVYELSFPATGAEQLRIDFVERRGKDRRHQLVTNLGDRFLSCPSV